MRWTIAKLVTVTLVTATCGQQLTIDNDVSATIPTDVLIPQYLHNNTSIKENLLDEESTYKEESQDREASRQPEIGISNSTPDPEEIIVELPEGTGSSNENIFPTSKEATSEVLLVNTTNGLVQGHLWNGLSDILGFIDIPYGKFSGPFQAPTTAESWTDVHQITEHRKRCPQLEHEAYVGDNDCLTLSIFTPANVENASILFHVHGGNFISGSGDPSIYGPEYLVPNGIILVLPNYRLGPLGFLCLQNETAPGNAALKDLTLALRWIRENIKGFGGNPFNIVVSGDGSAGALVGYLALSPRSKNYISKVITESGSVLSHWALDRNPIASASKLTDAITETGSLNDTLEEADVSTIIKAAKYITFTPCLEKHSEAFIEDTPWTMLNDHDINIAFMIGSASHAGAEEAMDTLDSSLTQLNDEFGLFLPDDLKFNSCEERNEIGEKFKAQYFGEEDIGLNHVKELSLCYTDASYLSPGIRAARLLVEADATVYFYEFAFVGSFNRELESMNNPVQGAVRSDIIGYLFTQEGITPDENTDEKRMVDLMVDLWVSFINTGKPTSENIEWNELKKADESEEEWLSINTESKSMKGLHVDRLQLWTQIYNEHFIEHNLAFKLKPRFYTAFIVLIVFWVGFCKSASHL